ncbi:MAG TPA: hypothetical protein VKT78_11355 [Fimbriimonadaceae bacterium]|nr:hypothetical protein [Fimbriimonadaceae bacterium]
MGNKLMFIVIGVIVVIGIVLGLGMSGKINIPGLTKPHTLTKKEKAAKEAAAKKEEQDKADAEAAAKQKAADDFQKLVAQRDQLVKAGKWTEALDVAQQVADGLNSTKPNTPELTAATDLVAKIQAEVDKAALPKPDLEKGYTKLAAVWNEMEPKDVAEMLLKKYTPETAAPILKKMDEDKVAAVMTEINSPSDPKDARPKDPAKAAAYGDALAAEVSKVPAKS